MNNTSLDFFQDGLNDKIKNMCNIIKLNDELEASFGSYNKPISLKKFNKLLKYLKYKSNILKEKVEDTISLDITYNYDQKTNSNYRLTISSFDNIKKFIQQYQNYKEKNHTIFSRVIQEYLNQDESTTNKILLINKIKDPTKFIKLDEYDIRIKYSNENSNIDQKDLLKLQHISDNEKYNILYRYKQRKSLKMFENEYFRIVLDITDVKSSKNINLISDSNSIYELEVDISFKKPELNDKMINLALENFGNIILELEKFLQESKLLVTKTESANVIKALNSLAYEDENESYKDLPAMQSASVEIQHILDVIPGNYTVTDKADGERYFLIIYKKNIYLISNNLEVKKIKNKIKTTHDLTVLDGEYLYIPQKKKNLYLAFDILFFNKQDLRGLEQLKERLKKLADVLKDIFTIDMIIGDIKPELNISVSDTDKIKSYHNKNMINHLNQLNDNLTTSESDDIINYKYFIFPSIGNQYEIYMLSTLMYDIYTSGSNIKCPYVLDGIIYTPINQKYTRNNRDIKYKILKWKPEKQNSIDFFVQFERNPDTNSIITVYDRTNEKSLEDYIDKTDKSVNNVDFNDMNEYKVNNSLYQILNLFVGKIKNNQENPVPFQKENDLNQAYIDVKDGFAVDIEGNVIEDNTVVEFAYNNNIGIPDKFRWIPLRTRFDKTESVMLFKRKYGNNFEIANKIWNSIKNPITYNDIKLLGDNNTAPEHIKKLKNLISSESIILARRDDSYYQIISNLGKSMRNYHNWIKSNMIYTYCGRRKLMDGKVIAIDVLDIGVGRGGDLMKFYTSRIKSAVAIDVNESGIFSGSDGAISRYNVFKKKMPGFPKISFLVADAGQKLDYDSQVSNRTSNDQNNKLLRKIFGDNNNSKEHYTFDVINAQFMIHYLFRDSNTWNNFCHNVNKYLRKDGYLLITTLDGQMVNNSFDKNGHIIRETIGDDGKKTIVFDLVKKYSTNINSINKREDYFGIQIDAHLPFFMEEGGYISEYLVHPSFLINELKTECNMRLVETESFQNLFYVYEDFFLNTANYESKIETKKFFLNVKEFYNQKDVLNSNFFEFSKLNRYYIFQKMN